MAHLDDLTHALTHKTELGLYFTENSTDYGSCVHCNTNFQLLAVFLSYCLHIIEDSHGEVSYSYRVMPVEEPGFNLLLCRFETTACHVCVTNGLNFL